MPYGFGIWRTKSRINGIGIGRNDEGIGLEVNRQSGREQIFVNNCGNPDMMAITVNNWDATPSTADDHGLQFNKLTNNIQFQNLDWLWTRYHSPRAVNGLCDIPIG